MASPGSDQEWFSAVADCSQAEPSPADEVRSRLLIADALASCLAAPQVRSSGFVEDGVTGIAALLALRMSSRDLDDVDWTSLHHPGSVVLPGVLALAGRGHRESVVRAVCAGYRVAATMADLLGADHRRHWHVTATAGAIGAAAACSVMLGATQQEQAASLALAAANTGGIGQAPLERRGAASFNRAAAAGLGLLAARAAIAGARPATDALTGRRGLLALTSGGDPDRTRLCRAPVREGVQDAALRLFPVTGFAHSAVLGTTMLRERTVASLISREGVTTPAAAELADGSVGGDWWNLPLAVARAWELGDPFAVDDTTAGAATLAKVRVTTSPLGNGQARVLAMTTDGTLDSGLVNAPGMDSAETASLERKWRDVLGQDPARMMETADAVAGTGTIDIESLVG